MIRLTVLVTDTTAPVLQQGRGLLIITIIDINEQPPVCLLASFFTDWITFSFVTVFTSFFHHLFVVLWRARLFLAFVRVNLAIKMKSVACTRLGISITLLFSIDKDSFFFNFLLRGTQKSGRKLQAQENVSFKRNRKITGLSSIIISREKNGDSWSEFTQNGLRRESEKGFSPPLFTSQGSCYL